MRCLPRLSLALFGLALAAPTLALAGQPVLSESTLDQQNYQKKHKHKHTGHLCANCQRAQLMAQGVYVPPVPSAPADGSIVGATEPCLDCQNGTVMAMGAPGHAVTGNSVPGYAVVGGTVPVAEPAPIGVVRSTYAMGGQGAGPRAPYDQSVMPTVASDPVTSKAHNRPHIIPHMFGLSAIGREGREAAERKKREDHASISYAPLNQQVTDLPASMVYGRGAR